MFADNNGYPLIEDFKLSVPLNESKLREAKEYFRWFLDIIPERLSILEGDIKKHFPEWQNDFSRDSMEVLAVWLKQTCELRYVSEEEREESIKRKGLKGHLANWTRELVTTKLTRESLTRIFDASIYFAESIRKNTPDIGWDIEREKGLEDTHHPVLVKMGSKPKGYGPLYAPRIIRTVTFRLLDNRGSTKSLIHAYDHWVKTLTIGYQLPPGIKL